MIYIMKCLGSIESPGKEGVIRQVFTAARTARYGMTLLRQAGATFKKQVTRNTRSLKKVGTFNIFEYTEQKP